jgi:hypothetical protein
LDLSLARIDITMDASSPALSASTD